MEITLQQVQVVLSVSRSSSCHPTDTFLGASASSVIHPRHWQRGKESHSRICQLGALLPESLAVSEEAEQTS